MMKLRTFFTLFLAVLCPAFAATPATPKVNLPIDRLARVYCLLKNAELMATAGILLNEADIKKAAGAMSAEALKTECSAIADRILAATSGGRGVRRSETLAYLKNAVLRLIDDREESHSGHVSWAHSNPKDVSKAIQHQAKSIKDTLKRLSGVRVLF